MSSVSRQSREERARERARAAKNHDRYVQRTYGLEAGEYARRLIEQDGRCAICTRRPRTRRLAVDHDHNTGRVRGLLCYTCNKFVLGFVEFDPIAAHNAAVYLGGIANDYGPEYNPFPTLSDPLVEASRAPRRPLRVPATVIKRVHDDELPF